MKLKKRLICLATVLCLTITAMSGLPNITASATSPAGTPYNDSGTYAVSTPHIIINQIYGGFNPSKDVLTNNADGTFTITNKDKGQACSNSFIELYNPTNADVDLNGWSLQYTAAPYYPTNQPTAVQNGNWAKLNLTGTIKAHCSYLIRGAATGSTVVTSTFGLNLLSTATDPITNTAVTADQDWNMPINTKGIVVALMDNQDQLAVNSNPFNYTTHAPSVPGYVDMLGVNGNDGTTTAPTNEFVQAYEGDATNSQSKQKAIRRVAFTDTDNNGTFDDATGSQQFDCQVIGYNNSDVNHNNWARPRTSADGVWYATAEPNPVETTTLSSTTANCLTNSFGTDPKTTRTFTWEMPVAVTSGQVEISTDSGLAGSTPVAAAVSSSDSGTANTFRATATNLTPGTTYYYRAENGSAQSSIYSFKTEAATVTSFSFVQISDTQADEDVQTSKTDATLNYGAWGTAVKTITQQYNPDFLLETGDIVDQQNSEDQWRWFFKEAQDTLGNFAYLPVIGNHDQSAVYPATAFQEHFTNANSCTDPNVTPDTVYSFDYGAAHFVILNSECKGAGFAAQHAWADQDMAKTKQPFIIVALHRGMYGGSGISDTFTAFGDLLDKYNVALVLQGHDHAYIRSKPMRNGAAATDGKGTIHLETGGSGSKQDNAPTLQNYMDTVATPGAPCYSVITVTDSKIAVHTVTVQNTSPYATASPAIQDLQTSATANTINPSTSKIDFTINPYVTAPTITPSTTSPTINDVTVTIAAQANATIQYSLDNGTTWNNYTTPLDISANTTVLAKDTVGATSANSSLDISNIDRTAPAAPTITPSTTSPTYAAVTVTITAEANANIQYSLNNGTTWTNYTAPFNISSNTTILARATDSVGNTSANGTLVISNINTFVPTPPTPPTPVDTTVTGITATTGSGGLTTTTAQIPISDTNTSTTANVIVKLAGVTVTAPASVLSGALGGDSTSTLALSQAVSPTATQSQVAAAAATGGVIPVSSLDIDLTRTSSSGSTTVVHQLSGSITIVVNLTAAQIAQLSDPSNARLLYFDPASGKLTDMGATFDLAARTVTFGTNHCSTYVIATVDKTAPVVSGVVNNGLYNANETITFNKGTATIDGAAFTSGDTVSGEGKHTLIVTDATGNVTTVTFTIDKTAPAVTGIAVGGIYNADKTITFIEGTATLDNADFASGDTVSAEGEHTLVVTDAAGNVTTIAFVIDKSLPAITLKSGKAADKNGAISASNVTVSVSDLFSITKSVAMNGKAITWPAGGTFTKDGKYIVSVKDQYGQIAKTIFTIDKTAPKLAAKRSKGGVTVTVNEANLLSETVTLNGKKLAWPRGNQFTAKGNYVVTVIDKAGHKAGYEFKI